MLKLLFACIVLALKISFNILSDGGGEFLTKNFTALISVLLQLHKYTRLLIFEGDEMNIITLKQSLLYIECTLKHGCIVISANLGEREGAIRMQYPGIQVFSRFAVLIHHPLFSYFSLFLTSKSFLATCNLLYFLFSSLYFLYLLTTSIFPSIVSPNFYLYFAHSPSPSFPPSSFPTPSLSLSLI